MISRPSEILINVTDLQVIGHRSFRIYRQVALHSIFYGNSVELSYLYDRYSPGFHKIETDWEALVVVGETIVVWSELFGIFRMVIGPGVRILKRSEGGVIFSRFSAFEKNSNTSSRGSGNVVVVVRRYIILIMVSAGISITLSRQTEETEGWLVEETRIRLAKMFIRLSKPSCASCVPIAYHGWLNWLATSRRERTFWHSSHKCLCGSTVALYFMEKALLACSLSWI